MIKLGREDRIWIRDELTTERVYVYREDRLRETLQDFLGRYDETCNCEWFGEERSIICEPCDIKERFSELFKDKEVQP